MSWKVGRVGTIFKDGVRMSIYKECVEFVDLPEDIHWEDLESGILDTFNAVKIKLKKQDIHAIHSLQNNKVVITKLMNRQDAIAILTNKRKLREILDIDKEKLRSNKIYVNKCLCPAFRELLGKYNST